MALTSNDFKISITPSDINTGLNCVIGHELSFKINFSNNSTTDSIYNISSTITLPDGLSFVSASITPTSNTIDSSFNNVISFINIKDLYPNEVNYSLEVTVSANAYYRANGAAVPYGHGFSNLSIAAKGDSMPRGNLDVGNTSVSTSSTTTITALRYYAKITSPPKYLKGAGVTVGSLVDATSIFDVSITLYNSTRDASNISLILNLANGLRYIGVWNSSGTNASNFTNPVISNVSTVHDHVKISFSNKTLSSDSITTLTFQLAIWNNYTLNGVENSGALIENYALLNSSLALTGNLTSFNTSFEIMSMDLLISQLTETLITDVSVLNEYTLNYSCSEYYSLLNTNFYFIIPDGMSYSSNSSTVTPTSIENINNTTVLTWSMGTLQNNSDNTIKLYTVTDSTYASGASVYSTDTFTTYFNVDYSSPDGSETITDTTNITLTSLAPIITTEVVGYYYNDLSPKNFQVAALGDYVRFNIIYDASNVVAAQKDVKLFDYPPLNISVTTATNIVTSGNIPPGTTYSVVPDNGVLIPLGTLNGGSYFEISFSLLVTEALQDSIIYNLAKAQLTNSADLSYSVRDSSLVYFGIPHLSINQSRSSSDCLSLNDTFTYTITIANSADSEINNIVDAYNINFSANIPEIFNIVGTPTISGAGEHETLTINNNTYSMKIIELEPNDTLIITSEVTVNDTPTLGLDYLLNASITNGTSQAAENSEPYTYNELPLDNTLTITSCIPTITKSYTPSTVKLYEYYTAKVEITFPAGCIAYNVKIKDSLVSTNSTFFSEVLLNNSPADYSLVTNNLTVPLADTLDTSTGPVTFTLTYKNLITTATTINYEQTRHTDASIDWSEEISIPESYAISATANIKVVVPGLSAVKYQSNLTQAINYDLNPIYCSLNDVISYKTTLTNIGKSPAYSLVFSDVIPNNLTYLSNNINGTYDPATRIFTGNVPDLSINGTTDVIITASVNNDNNTLVASNSASTSYKANDTAPNIFTTTTSNVTSAYRFFTLASLEKSQKNTTAGGDFTTSTIKCYTDQSIQYKVKITNSLPNTMTNLSITDTFPNVFTFVSFEEFTLGTLSITNNVITATIPTLAGNSSIEYIYNLKLESNNLTIASSSAELTFTYANSPNSYSLQSNTLYIKLAGLGKGFKIY